MEYTHNATRSTRPPHMLSTRIYIPGGDSTDNDASVCVCVCLRVCVCVSPQAELEDTTGVELIQGRSAGCARSMVAVKKEKVSRALNFSRVMHELTMLGSFIRLADYLFVEGTMNMCLAQY